MNPKALRREFFAGILVGLRVLWPVLSTLLIAMIALGLIAGYLEGWSLRDSLYFTFISGLTIGYGDLAPKNWLARLIAIFIGLCGILMTALVAALAVKALNIARGNGNSD